MIQLAVATCFWLTCNFLICKKLQRKLLFTVRQWSYGKVMYSLVSVILSTGRECLVPGPFLGWVCLVSGPFLGVVGILGDTRKGWVYQRYTKYIHPLKKIHMPLYWRLLVASEVDGTHPTGMISCVFTKIITTISDFRIVSSSTTMIQITSRNV